MRSVVLFDFGGTLDADGEPWSRRFHRAYRASGGVLNGDSFEPAFSDSDLALGGVAGIRRMGWRDTIETQARLLLERVPDGSRLEAARIAEAFRQEAAATTNRNRALLADLSRTYRLGVVSNFTGNLAVCLEEIGLAGFFEVIADSGRVGSAKPDQRLFTHALGALGVEPEAAWMVGDNPSRDIAPAAELGCATCWIAHADRRHDIERLATARISRLDQLPPVLVR